MTGHPYIVVDVFAEKKYAGNQLAVFTDGGRIPAENMLTFARETHYSETTFILSGEPREGGWDVRIFTPGEEVPFAGHPTLGTAWVIGRELTGGEPEEIVLNLKVGQIPVRFETDDEGREVLWMRQNEPDFGADLAPEVIAPVLGLDLWDIDDRFPVQDVSTGLPFLIVPVKDLEALRGAAVRREEFFELIADTRWKAPLIFCPETRRPDNDLSVRVFVDYYNITEDPATGSANGCLAAWLVRHRYFGSDRIDIRVEQGHEIHRPSLLHLQAAGSEAGIEVHVGGSVIETARGEFV